MSRRAGRSQRRRDFRAKKRAIATNELELQAVAKPAELVSYGQDEQAWRLTWSLP